MTKNVPLNHIQHQDLKIITRHGSDLDDNLTFAVVFPHEFKRVQGEYPIFFRKNEKRRCYEAIALFGFAEFENLFVDEQGWHADYIPITVKRRPFMIGFQPTEQDGQVDDSPMVYVDMDSPRVNTNEGESVFLPHGGYAPHLEQVNSMLQDIFTGDNAFNKFAKTLEAHDLLEPFSLKVNLTDDDKLRIEGFYTINEEKFYQLADQVLGQFQRQGYLSHIYMMMASINNLHKMIRLKKAKLVTKSSDQEVSSSLSMA